MSSDLSDVLRDMADDRRRQQRDAGADAEQPGDDQSHAHDAGAGAPADALHASQGDDAVDVPAEALDTIDDEAGDALGASPRRRRPSPSHSHHHLKRVAIPVLITVGGLLLLLGIWGTAVLGGAEVPLHDKDGAGRMATAMIVAGYPLGLSLLAGAVYFHSQVRRVEQQAKRGRPRR